MSILEIDELTEKIDRVSFLKERLPSGAKEPCFDRAILITEGYKDAAADPVILRRAKALANVLNKMTVRIFDEELVVGDQSVSQQSGNNYPEFGSWGELTEVATFWQENPELRATGSLFGHTVPGFQKLIDKGFSGIQAEAQAKLDSMDSTDAEQVSKEPFWEAMVVLAEAAGNYGRRYAEKAREMAAFEENPRRKRELERIAEACQQVPHGPARNFYEALQALWFGFMMTELEDPPNAHSVGRIDQMLYPFYKSDVEAGTLTEEEASELLSCFALKIWKSYDVQDTMIGGQNPDGTDAVNDVSFLYLDAVEKLDLHIQLSARYHKNISRAFWYKVAETNSKCRGLPQMFSDEAIVPALVRKGVPVEEARDYAIIGCIEVTIPGRCDPRVVNHYTNMAKCLEYALNDGVCLMTGNQGGAKTGDPATFTSYEDVWEAYKAQIAYDI